MEQHLTSPSGIFSSLFRYRDLIWQLTKRDVIGRYKGSIFGLAWSFFNPLIMLTIYTIVFSTIFQARWSDESESKIEFALVLFIGMIIHGIIAETLARAPSLIIENVSYVKKIVFPLEVLPWVMMGATMFHTAVSVLVWILFYLLVYHSLHWTILFLPLVLLPLLLFSMGLSWFFSATGVYLRDIRQLTAVFTTVLMFLSPVFYPVSKLSEPYRSLMYLNPMTYFIEESRSVMMWGEIPDPTSFLVALIAGLFFAWMGFIWFQKTRKGFADVL